MPVISAFADHPTHPYVRVEINWADTPSVEYAGVYRVDVATGECTPLRPYICYNGWELLLSCGSGIFWDTEAPFDRPFYYLTTSSEAPCLPASALLLDTFARTSASTWTTADSGQAYQHFGGAAGNYTVAPGTGTIAVPGTGTDMLAVADVGVPDQDIVALVRPFATPTGGTFLVAAVGRATDASNYYMARFTVTTAGAVTLSMRSRIAGVLQADLDTATLTGVVDYTAAPFYIRFQLVGPVLKARAWSSLLAEPTTWDLEATNTGLTTGNLAGVMGRREGGSLTPTSVGFAHLQVDAPCVPCAPVAVDTGADPITIANDGRFWLKDPVRPCHDRPVPLCVASAPVMPDCGGDSGILFLGIGPETYGANSVRLRPMNRARPLSMTRPRSDATTALRLQTVTFTDRDDLLALAAPGSPLLFQGPADYGVPDRYMDVADVQVSPVLPDLRFQVRTEVLPYETMDRQAGPTQGICGARVADICELYPTWGDLAAAGFTWNDLVAGQASPVSANPNRRTWDDVAAEFADWDAVAAGGRTWDGLEAGL